MSTEYTLERAIKRAEVHLEGLKDTDGLMFPVWALRFLLNAAKEHVTKLEIDNAR